MKLSNKKTAASVAVGGAIYIAPAYGHLQENPFELYGYHETEEWVNYGLSLPILAANLFIRIGESVFRKELGYKSRVGIGIGTVFAWKGFQAAMRSVYGTDLFEPESTDYQSLFDIFGEFDFTKNFETARDLIRGILVTPFTRKGYEYIRNRF